MVIHQKLKLKLVHGYGKSSEIRDVQCQEERGKFYVSVQTLNASNMGAGLSPAEAAADYAKKCRATSHLLIADGIERVADALPASALGISTAELLQVAEGALESRGIYRPRG